MSMSEISRGHPLIALLAVLGGWIGGRVVNWEPPVAPYAEAKVALATAPPMGVAGGQSLPGYEPIMMPGFSMPARAPEVRIVRVEVPVYRFIQAKGGHDTALTDSSAPSRMPHLGRGFADMGPASQRFYAPEVSGVAASASPTGVPVAPPRPRRWSMDAWALLRRDGGGALSSAGALPASYGASQSGGVLRYRLGLTDPRRPTLYLRGTTTTGRLRETAAALGLSARPIPAVPIITAVEGRMTEYAGQRSLQGAAMAITELPPIPLASGFRAEGYGQAGYVAGEFATPFADGQIRVDRSLIGLGNTDVRLGAGVWGGAQKGAARLDAGPAASIALPLRTINTRVAFDWRFRVAGDAVPDSGPALTVSAGF